MNGGPPPQKSGIKIIFFLVFISNKIESGGGKRGGQLVGDMFLRGLLWHFASLIGSYFSFLGE